MPWLRRQSSFDERDDEQASIAACGRGDDAACAWIVRRYQDTALRTAFLITNDRQAAEDIAQNAFLSAFRHLGRFDPARAFRPWFLTILTNEARMYLRSQRRQPVTVADPLDLSSSDVDPVVTRLIRNDDRAHVRAALMELEEPFRTAIVLYYFNEMSIDEIAAATAAASGTVKSRLHRGRERLREALCDDAAATSPINGNKVNVTTRRVLP